eukprot:SAG31_NODE_5280_length_2635_cov_2.574921_2_plen_84_part_00
MFFIYGRRSLINVLRTIQVPEKVLNLVHQVANTVNEAAARLNLRPRERIEAPARAAAAAAASPRGTPATLTPPAPPRRSTPRR